MEHSDKNVNRCPRCGSDDLQKKDTEKNIINYLILLFLFVLDLFSKSNTSASLEMWNSMKSGLLCRKCGCIFRNKFIGAEK